MSGPWRNDTLLAQRCKLDLAEARRQIKRIDRRYLRERRHWVIMAYTALLIGGYFYGRLLVHLLSSPIRLDSELPLKIGLLSLILLPLLAPPCLIHCKRRRIFHHLTEPICFKCGYTLAGLPRQQSCIPCLECGNHSPVAPHPDSP